MRKLIQGVVVAVGLSLAGLTAAAAAPMGGMQSLPAAQDGMLQKVSYYCERLRRACVHKEERGEAGEGNCRRYREECGGGRRSHCETLRHACEYKEDRGETGEGNCRRYRRECQ